MVKKYWIDYGQQERAILERERERESLVLCQWTAIDSDMSCVISICMEIIYYSKEGTTIIQSAFALLYTRKILIRYFDASKWHTYFVKQRKVDNGNRLRRRI
jgi:hypothetical protein